MARMCPDANLLNDPMGGTSDFELPKGSVKISEIYLGGEKGGGASPEVAQIQCSV